MLSDLTFREAQIWTQTESPSTVSVHYFETSNPGEIFITPKIKTTENNGCTANFSLQKLNQIENIPIILKLMENSVLKKYTFNSLNYFHEKEPPPDVRIAVLRSTLCN